MDARRGGGNRWGATGFEVPELTTHGRAPGCASTAVAAVCFRAHIWSPSSPPKGSSPTRSLSKRGRLGRREGGAAEREVSALRGRTSTTATDGDDPRTGGSRVVPLSAKMAGVQPMGRVRPQASASPYRQQPQKRFSVRF